jgi:hypothetical protein
MSPIQTAYINALLADASYVERVAVGSVTAGQFSTRLTSTQAAYLAANFTVLASEESSDGGFDAVVWRVKDNSSLATSDPQMVGKVFVSMRSTQGLQDIADDVSLALKGIPHLQIANMVNWWLKNTAAANTPVTT